MKIYLAGSVGTKETMVYLLLLSQTRLLNYFEITFNCFLAKNEFHVLGQLQ